EPPCLKVVALAASAGGLEALTHVLAPLPSTFPATIIVVQHLDPRHPSFLVDILGRRTRLHVQFAEQGGHLRAGSISVARPDWHLLVDRDGTFSLRHSERICYVRPSADMLFESLAHSLRERVIAVVLSGTGRDGANGVRAVKEMGGVVIVQDLMTSAHHGMPQAAAQTGCADFCLPLDEIAPKLVALVHGGGLA